MPKRRRSSRALAVLLLAAALPAAGCFSFPAMPFPETTGTAGADGVPPGTLGSFAVSSPVLGDTTVAPTACAAGDLQQFLGGDFHDPVSNLVVRLVVDPLDGPAARVFHLEDRFQKSVVLRRSECATFHFSLEHTGMTIDDVRDYRLSLELDCALADGTTVHGSVSSTHCH